LYAEFDGDDRFVCPKCQVSHGRGSVDGFGYSYRCLKCGQTYQVDPDVIRTMEEARYDDCTDDPIIVRKDR
jgi:tRNA(Ile2) C34 agmatinyltransferase TiaS